MNTHRWKLETPVALSEVDQTSNAETPIWTGTIEEFVRENDLSEGEIAEVCADLFCRREHLAGGGAAQLFVLRIAEASA